MKRTSKMRGRSVNGVGSPIASSPEVPNLPSLLLLPGLGIDRRVYGPQMNLPLDIHFFDWIEPESRRESLAHYSVRMAAQMSAYQNAYIGGISLGAMVAIEAARSLSVRGVISIGGCSSPRQIAPLFRAALKIGAMLPSKGIKFTFALAPLALRTAEKLNPAQVELMNRMFRIHSLEQIRWSCRAILDWQNAGSPNDAPLYHIHGEDDEVIPISNIKVQQAVPKGRHLISLSHPTEVNQFIVDCMLLDRI